MNQLVPQNFGPVSARFQGVSVENDLGAGVQAGFGLIGYRGKVWSTRYRGEERQLMREDGDGPRGSIEVVILKASGVVSKIFYEAGYVEGSSAAPDCFSTNGVTPDASAAKKQAVACAACPKNVWGSRVTPAGKQGKACQDSKRLAVVPMGDIANEVYGGPMLLRVPAASLQDLAGYGAKMAQLGYPYYSVATRVSFDAAESYPKFVFQAIRPLSDAEADLVLTMQKDPGVTRVIAESEFVAIPGPAAQVAAVAAAFEQPPVTPVVAPVVVQAPQPAPAPAPAPQPAQVASGFGTTAAPTANPTPAAQPNPTTGEASTTPAPTADFVAPSPDTVAPVASSPPPDGGAGSVVESTSSNASSFEDELDAKLAALLPPA